MADNTNAAFNLIIADASNQISSDDSRRIVIHAVGNSVDGLVKSASFITAPFHILISTPSSRAQAEKSFAALAELGCWCKLVNLDDDVDIAKMSAQLGEFLDRESVLVEGNIVVDLSNANRFLWKAMEIGTMKYETAPKVFLDWKNERCQFCRDYVNWQNISLPKEIIKTSHSETSSIKGNLSNQEEFVNQQNDSFEDCESIQGHESVEWNASATIAGKTDKSISEVSTVKTKFNKTHDAILADQEICRYLWDFSKIITEVRDWNYSGNDSHEKMTFQDVARSFTPPFQAKIQGEGELEGKRIIFNAKTTPYQIQFYANDDSKKNNCVFTFNFTDWKLPEVRAFLGGRWFEEYVYLLADELKMKYSSSIRISINEIMFNHEIDVLITSQTRDILIECKTGKFKKDVVESFNEKVSDYARNMPSKYSQPLGVIVSLQKINNNTSASNAVKDCENVYCISGENVPTLMERFLSTLLS